MRALLAAAALGLTGCTVTSIDPAKMTPQEMATRPDYVPILPGVPKDAKTIGLVKATLCQKLKEDRSYTTENVYTELKRQAALAGGTGLANVSISVIDKGTRTCFWSGTAQGVAWYRSPAR